MTINIMKNTEPAPYMGSVFGQDVEPFGTYVTEKDTDNIKHPWVSGIADLNKPLIINITDDTIISYKYDLANTYKAKGKNLTKKLMSKGYDGIITKFPNGSTNEIILFPNCRFMLHPNESKVLIKNLLRESLLPEAVKGGTYTLYHGSPTKINSFSDDFVGGEDAVDQEGPGVYFTNSQDDARMYGENIHVVTLNPSILYDETPPSKKLIPLITKLVKMAPDWEENAQNYDENPAIGLNNFISSAIEYNDSEKDVILQVWIDFYRYKSVDFVRNCTKLGIDGIMVNRNDGVKHFIIYNPNAINIVK